MLKDCHLLIGYVLLVLGLSEAAYLPNYEYIQGVGWLRLHIVPATWADAQLRCHLEDATLTAPTTSAITAVMKKTMVAHRLAEGSVFTDIYASNPKGDFTSSNGLPMSSITLQWAVGEPNNLGNEEDCLVMTGAGELADVSCASVHPFFCLKRNTTSKRDECDTRYIANECNNTLEANQRNTTHNENECNCPIAANQCNTTQGVNQCDTSDQVNECNSTIIIVNECNNTLEANQCNTTLEANQCNTTHNENECNCTIEANQCNTTQGVNQCDTSDQVNECNSTIIIVNECNNTLEANQCNTTLETNQCNTTHNENECNCTIEANQCITTHEANQCDTTDQGYAFEPRTGSCYKVHNEVLPWRRAAMFCAAEHAHLAVINNEVESKVLKELFATIPWNTLSGFSDKYHAHIGFMDWNGQSQWMTIFGEPIASVFHTWAYGEPNHPGKETCGSVTDTGFLNDVFCTTHLYPFICETPLK